MSKKTIGIDLGTTNSCVAIHDQEGRTIVIDSKTGRNTLPSVLSKKDGRYVVGDLAKRESEVNSSNTIIAAKRLMGKQYKRNF